MEYKEKIEELSNKLDLELQRILYENSNYLPTITSTFHCIENSSKHFKELIRSNFSLENIIKKEIGKVLNFHHTLDKSIKPPFTNYFTQILTSLMTKKPDN